MKTVGVLGVLLVIACCMVTSTNVLATDTPWTTGRPTVFQDTPIVYVPETPCPTYYQDISIAGISGKKPACRFGGGDFVISRFLQDNGKSALAVQMSSSRIAHRLEGICEGQIGCMYSAEKDLLVTNMGIAFNQQGVEVFRRASRRISMVFDPASLSIRYVFDAANPDYVFQDIRGVSLSSRAFALSNNGEWLAIELKNYGTAIVHATDFSARRVVSTGPQYGVGLDPTVEMAISNSGKSLVIAGSNASFLMVDIVEGCGDVLIADFLYNRPPPHLECPSAPGVVPDLVPPFFTILHPRLDDSGEQLTFRYAPRGSSVRAVTIRTARFHIAERQYIALGDSFSSGEGETDDRSYRIGTNSSFDTCHVSTRSYPFLIGIPDVENIACAGAKLEDLVSSRADYRGQGDRLGPTGHNLSNADLLEQSRRALDDYQPGRVPQADFIDRFKPAVATVGIGGNDAGLMTKLRSCAMVGTCDWASSKVRPQVADEIRSLYDKLVALYANLSALSPATRLYAVGYPRIIERQGVCDAVTGLLLDHNERVFMDEGIRYLNEVIEAATKKAGVGYLNVENSYDGKRLCSGAPTLAMNGLRYGGDIAILSDLPLLKIIGSETFHPTPTGHRMVADVIGGRYGDLRNYSWCSNSVVRCSSEVSAPTPSSYWALTNQEASRSLQQRNFATTQEDTSFYRVMLPSRTLRPGSLVQLEVRSPVIGLASLVVNHSGGLDELVRASDDLVEGIYTLHLKGIDYEGSLVEFYQEITVTGRPQSTVPDEEGPGPTTVPAVVKRNFGKPSSPEISRVQLSHPLAILGATVAVPAPQTITAPYMLNDDNAQDDSTFIILWTLFCLLLTVLIIAIILWGTKAWRGT